MTIQLFLQCPYIVIQISLQFQKQRMIQFPSKLKQNIKWLIVNSVLYMTYKIAIK